MKIAIIISQRFIYLAENVYNKYIRLYNGNLFIVFPMI